MKKPKVWNQWSKIRSALRRVWLYSPQRREALNKAKMADGMYWCLLCMKPYEKWGMEVDHIEPCGTLTDYTDTETFIRRLFGGELQAICKPCHKLKRRKK